MNEVTKMSGYSRFKILFETNFRFEMERKLECRPRTRNGFFKRGRLTAAVGTLRSEDGDGRKNFAEKVNPRSFNLHRDYSKSLTLSNVGEPS